MYLSIDLSTFILPSSLFLLPSYFQIRVKLIRYGTIRVTLQITELPKKSLTELYLSIDLSTSFFPLSSSFLLHDIIH